MVTAFGRAPPDKHVRQCRRWDVAGHATALVGTHELVAAWVAFIAAQESWYESLAVRAGLPYTRHTPDELRVAGEVAATFGVRPPEVMRCDGAWCTDRELKEPASAR